MGIFCITRKTFLDREFDFEKLTMLAEMLREWSGMCTSGVGSWHCEAKVYALPRADLRRVHLGLKSRLPGVAFEDSDEDELGVIGKPSEMENRIDLGVWEAVLNDAVVRGGCVILRLTLEGQFLSLKGDAAAGKSTFVLCGEPVENGVIVKAIWQVGFDESMGLVYRSVAWEFERRLVEAFDQYLTNHTTHPYDAAGYALGLFGGEASRIFLTRWDQVKVMTIIRHRAEMPDDRGPGAFIRRVAYSFLLALACLAVAVVTYRISIGIAAVFLVGGGYFIFGSCRIFWKKLGRVRAYHRRMRAGLGKLYSGPISYKLMDLSGDMSPSLRKCSAEIEELGGEHICDICITTAKGVLDGNRVYRLRNGTMAIGLLRKTDNLLFFPAKPVLMCKARFVDGRRHYTQNQPKYRKRSLMHVTGRCLLNEGGAAELLELHDRQVEKLIASGAVLRRVEQKGAEVLAGMEKEHEEAREGWERSPYSWGDAVHDAFKVCRREYLGD